MTKYDKNRPHQKMYDARWARYSKAFIRTHKPFKNDKDKRLRDIVGLCVYCLQVGKTTPATVTDHIIPHKGDLKLFWDANNHQPLCKPCHDGPKQLEESRGYQIGHSADGMPLGRHPWNEE